MNTAPPRTVPKSAAALAGLLGAAAALAIGELVTALGHDRPSLVAAVGNRFVDEFAAGLKQLAVRLFGTNDKPALVVGIVVSSLIFGVVLGLAARARRWIGAAGLVAFGVLGAYAYATDARGGGALGVIAAAAAVVAGCVVLFALLSAASRTPTVAVGAMPTPAPMPAVEATPVVEAMPAVERRPIAEPMPAPRWSPSTSRAVSSSSNRRTFLLRSAAIGAGVVGVTMASRVLRSDSTAAAARRTTVLPRATSSRSIPAGLDADVPGISPYVTPTGDFYRIDTALLTPDVDPSSWKLQINGMVDRPFSITYDELLALATVSEPVTLQCVSNEIGGNLVGNAVWQGVPLSVLLDRAGVQAGATQIVGTSVDGWTAGFPTALGTDGRVAMVAVAMNGEPLPVAHGFPARLVVAGLYGYVSATKWISEITLTRLEDVDGYWIPRGWSKDGPIKTMSRIDVPRSKGTLTPGKQPIAGVAWAPDRGISKVEVQIDDGAWMECRLGDTASENTWVQWVYEWDATPGSYRLRVRATDGTGAVQTEDRAEPAPNGASGWPQRTVKVGS